MHVIIGFCKSKDNCHVSHSFLVAFCWQKSSQRILDNQSQTSNRFNCLDKLSSFLLSGQLFSIHSQFHSSPSFSRTPFRWAVSFLSQLFEYQFFCAYFSSLSKTVQFVKSKVDSVNLTSTWKQKPTWIKRAGHVLYFMGGWNRNAISSLN